MHKYLKIFSPVLFLACVILIIFFKTIPIEKLWKDYSVLYVQKDVSDDSVQKALVSSDIQNYVCLSNQFLPINISENSIEYTMFKLNASKNDYSNRRVNYFFDKSKNFRLYYIPNEYVQNLSHTVHILAQNKIECGVDSKQNISYFLFLFFIIAVTVLSVFAKNRTIFLGTCFLELLYLWCNPFYPVTVSLIILLLPVFFISNIWKRDGFIEYLATNFWCIIIIAICIICNFSISLKTGIIFLVLLLSIFLFMIINYVIEDYFTKKYIFVPVFIKSAKMVSLFARRSKIVMTSLILITFCTISFFFFTSTKKTNVFNSKSKIYLPSHVQNLLLEDKEELVQLEDYYSWVWNIKTNPYKSLNKENNEFYVEFPHYIEENGKITETKTIYSYNQNFKDNVFDSIDELQFDSIEKVIKSEGKDFKGGYTGSKNISANLFSIIMMFFCLIILLFIYFSIIILQLRKIKK